MTKIALSNNAPVILPANAQNIASAAYMLHQGEIVAFPTETVYGLGARADDPEAIAAIYRMKGRPANNPLIVHVTDTSMAERYGFITDHAYALMQHFFPAPLTLIVPVRARTVAQAVLAGGKSVALRSPSHPIARALLEAVGMGIAAPSANRSGRISPTSAAHVASEFATSPLHILDGGTCDIGVESTVVDCRGSRLRILRHGAITYEAITAIVGDIIDTDTPPSEKGDALVSPGQLVSHYAPQCAVRLNATEVCIGEAALNFSSSRLNSNIAMLNLSEGGVLEEAAHSLYAHLRALDEMVMHNPSAYGIAVAPVPERGIGIAINDRLRRAAAEK